MIMEFKEITELVGKAKNGDQSAITQLYEATSKAVYFTALKIVGNPSDAEDIAQDTYVTAISKLSELKDDATFPKWIKTIAANTAKNYMTKKKPMLFNTDEDEQATLDSIPEISDEFIPDAAADKKETCRLVSEMIDSLPEKQRAALVMFYYDEMTISEIAEAMGTNDNTIKSRLNYARKYIKDEVEALAKKGTKLYGIAGMPLIAFVLRNLAADTAVPAGIALKVTAATVATAAATTTATATATMATTAATTVTTTATGFAFGTAAKVAIAAVASVVVIGGGVAVSKLVAEEVEPVIAQTTVAETVPVTTTTTTAVMTTTVPTETETQSEIVERVEYLEGEEADSAAEMIKSYLKGTGSLDYEALKAIHTLRIIGDDYVCVNWSKYDVLIESSNFNYETMETEYFFALDSDYETPINKGNISDIFFINEMPQLSHLEISYCDVSDYSPILENKNITGLDLDYDNISAEIIDEISENKSLIYLSLDGYGITDVSLFADMERLNVLSLNDNEITDISSLEKLTELSHLYLKNNNISDISILKEFKIIENLDLSENNISDISSLSKATMLKNLWMYNNEITDISVLSNLTELEWLNFNNNHISDVSALSNLIKLKKLELENNDIMKISAVADLIALEEIWLGNNQISDISALSKLKNMKWLIIWNNPISEEDIDSLEATLPNCVVSYF